jgi:hypothetical protein
MNGSERIGHDLITGVHYGSNGPAPFFPIFSHPDEQHSRAQEPSGGAIAGNKLERRPVHKTRN